MGVAALFSGHSLGCFRKKKQSVCYQTEIRAGSHSPSLGKIFPLPNLTIFPIQYLAALLHARTLITTISYPSVQKPLRYRLRLRTAIPALLIRVQRLRDLLLQLHGLPLRMANLGLQLIQLRC